MWEQAIHYFHFLERESEGEKLKRTTRGISNWSTGALTVKFTFAVLLYIACFMPCCFLLWSAILFSWQKVGCLLLGQQPLPNVVANLHESTLSFVGSQGSNGYLKERTYWMPDIQNPFHFQTGTTSGMKWPQNVNHVSSVSETIESRDEC